MSREGIPGGMPEHGLQPQFDFEQALLTTGLSPEDLGQEVQFGQYKGTLASALNPESACPLRDMVEKAYAEEGIDGVQKTFTIAGMMDREFKPNISEKTLAYHAGQVDRSELLRDTQVGPDFLA